MKTIFAVLILVAYFHLINAQNPQCVTPDSKAGTCIALRRCNSLFNLLQKKPLSAQERNFLARSQCGYRNGSPWVCCGESEPTSQPNQSSQPGQPLTLNDLPRPETGECGNQVVASKIIGGTETKIDEFPWMALIQYLKPRNATGFHCGGVLINKNYVLTASHCVNGKDLTALGWKLNAVRLGEWDLSTPEDCEDETGCAPPVQDIPVIAKIPHEGYIPSSKQQENDIALLRLGHSVDFNQFVRPICLPVSDNLKNMNYDRYPLDVAGWGKTETASNSNIKLKVAVDGVPLDQCNSVYRSQGVTIGSKQLCAGGVKGFDSCRGDSGGPLMAYMTDRLRPFYFLAGVVSFGPTPCGMEGWPGVYTRVDKFTDWIVFNMRA